MARKATGTLQLRSTGWYAKYWAIVDGERVRLTRALGTHNKAFGKRKLKKLIAGGEKGIVSDPRAVETFAEAVERIYGARIETTPAAVRKGLREELSSLRRYAFEAIGAMAVTEVKPTDVNSVLDAAEEAGRSRQSLQHTASRSNAAKTLLMRPPSMPRFEARPHRERAVLTDHEVAVYLGWEHPIERFRDAVRERETMAVVARCFGGLRTGDLHALRWEAFDTEHGRVPKGLAKRPGGSYGARFRRGQAMA